MIRLVDFFSSPLPKYDSDYDNYCYDYVLESKNCLD